MGSAVMDALQEYRAASLELLASRYSDGECDAVAIHRFASRVAEIEQTLAVATDGNHVGHKIVLQEQPGWVPRRGCLDCDVWLDPVRLSGAEDK
jgi:hypothetical protein